MLFSLLFVTFTFKELSVLITISAVTTYFRYISATFKPSVSSVFPCRTDKLHFTIKVRTWYLIVDTSD